LIDHDTKFTAAFDAVLEADGAAVIRLGLRAPNLNAYAERFVQTLRVECLDHFVVCGEKYLRHLVEEYLVHYHEERPHQGRGNVPLSVADRGQVIAHRFPDGPVVCHERLGGLLKHYDRAAA
jgi:putative transposase